MKTRTWFLLLLPLAGVLIYSYRETPPAPPPPAAEPARIERLGPAGTEPLGADLTDANPTEQALILQAIAKKQIRIGMTTDQVIQAWGRPERINETRRARSHHEQWVYPNSQYLYFENDVLTTVQQTRR